MTNSTFEGNEIGLSAYFGSATVTDSVFRGNTGFGVLIGRGLASVVEMSQFEGNGQGVFLWDEDNEGSDDAVVRENHFTGNGVGVRVSAFSAVARARIEGNQVDENNGAGIDVIVFCDGLNCGGQGMVIEGNHLRRNGFAVAVPTDGGGIRVRGAMNVTGAPFDPTWVTLSGNQADRNADLGIDAPGVTDGGRNRAKFNGDPQECVGVDCKVPGAKKLGKGTDASAAADAERLMNLLAGLPHH